eukprot:scaffold14867_cov29-Tisochrysis_lutea.AAC.5
MHCPSWAWFTGVRVSTCPVHHLCRCIGMVREEIFDKGRILLAEFSALFKHWSRMRNDFGATGEFLTTKRHLLFEKMRETTHLDVPGMMREGGVRV